MTLTNYKRHFGPRPAIRGRRRFFDPGRQVEFCERVAAGASLEEAAEAMDVSIRTVQREMKHDEDFDHEVRLALRATPEPEKLLEGHARTHWRAAAWLLERTKPEQFGKRRPNTATPFQVEKALQMVLEATLAATPPEVRSEMYRLVQPSCERAFQWVFPEYGPFARRLKSDVPETPLGDYEQDKHARDPRFQRVAFQNEYGSVTVTDLTLPANSPPEQPPQSIISSAPAALLSDSKTPTEEPAAKEPAKEPVAPARAPKAEPEAPARASEKNSEAPSIPPQPNRPQNPTLTLTPTLTRNSNPTPTQPPTPPPPTTPPTKNPFTRLLSLLFLVLLLLTPHSLTHNQRAAASANPPTATANIKSPKTAIATKDRKVGSGRWAVGRARSVSDWRGE